MAKRMTCTMKWDKEWFQELDVKHKCLWMYLCDKCNHAGIWDVNIKLAEFVIGAKFDKMDILFLFEKHIYEIPNTNKWFLVDFIEFQYGELRAESAPHRSVIALLEKEGLWCDGELTLKEGLPKGYLTPKDKEKDIDKDISKDLCNKPAKSKYGDDVTLTDAEHEKLTAEHGIDAVRRMVLILDTYKGAHGKKYKSDYKAILNWVVDRYYKDNPKIQAKIDTLGLAEKQAELRRLAKREIL